MTSLIAHSTRSKTKSVLLHNCTIGRSNTPLITGVSLDATAGEITHIKGPNGVGKSTLLETVIGEVEPLAGKRDNKLPRYGTRSHQFFFGYMPARVHPLPSLTINQWVNGIGDGLGVEKRKIEILWRRLNGRALPKSRLEHLSSGNLRKALAINAFAIQRKMLILDEPFEEIDTTGREVIGDLISEQATGGAAVLVVSHTPLPQVNRIVELHEDMSSSRVPGSSTT